MFLYSGNPTALAGINLMVWWVLIPKNTHPAWQDATIFGIRNQMRQIPVIHLPVLGAWHKKPVSNAMLPMVSFQLVFQWLTWSTGLCRTHTFYWSTIQTNVKCLQCWFAILQCNKLSEHVTYCESHRKCNNC